MRCLVSLTLCSFTLLACHGAGTDSPPGEDDGGTPPAESKTDLSITATTYYLGGASVEQKPYEFDGADGVVPPALVPDGKGGYSSKRGELVAAGQVKYSGVSTSAGPVWLLINDAWRPVTESTATFGLARRNRLGGQGSAGTDTITLDFKALQAWNTSNHSLELYTPSLDVTLTHPNTLANGFTAGTKTGTSTLRANELAYVSTSPSLGDIFYAFQVESASSGSTWPYDTSDRVISAAAINDLSLPAAGGARRTLTMSTAPKRSVSITVNTPAFEATAAPPSIKDRFLRLDYQVEAHLPAPKDVFQPWNKEAFHGTIPGELRMLNRLVPLTSAPTSAFTWDTSYADALPATQRRFVQATYTMTDARGNEYGVNAYQLAPASGTVTLSPVVSVPRDVQIQGTTQSGITTFPGLAHLSWSPPATGTATSYEVVVYYIDVSRYVLGHMITSATDVVIPLPLKPGLNHYAVITALNEGTDKGGSATLTTGLFRNP